MKKLILSLAFGVFVSTLSAQIVQEPVQTSCGVVTPFTPFPCAKKAAPAPPTAPPAPLPVVPTMPVANALLCSPTRVFNFSTYTNYPVPFHVDPTGVPAIAPYPFVQSPQIGSAQLAANQQCTIDYLTVSVYIMPYVTTYATAYPAWWAANQATYLQNAANYSGDSFEYGGTVYAPKSK